MRFKHSKLLPWGLLLAGFFLSDYRAWAQDDQKKWSVTDFNKNLSANEVSIQTSEGTWMNVDVSPDGKEIAFDLLGDIYLMPITGGTAKLLRGGAAWEVQPRFSPDGSKIAFTSDAEGGDNIWTMSKDGSNAKSVTTETMQLLNNPCWTPDGQYIVARKHFTSERSAGAGEMWLYHVSGGSGTQLTARKNDQQDVNEPSMSPDGRYLYFSEDFYPGGYFQYNKNPNSMIYVIRRFDRQKGRLDNIIAGPGGAFRPQVSPNGQLLAFVKRVQEKTVLYVHNLATGEEYPVYDKLSKDQQEAWALFGAYTGYNWLPDNQHVVIWAQGKIMKVDTKSFNATEIPFVAEAKHRVTDAVRFEQKPYDTDFEAQVIRHATTSPDGKTLLFSALGYIWKKDLPSGTPTRLTTQSTDFEAEPCFSPDGNSIVYVTWNDENYGSIYQYAWKNPKLKPEQLIKDKGIYRTPAFSPDGKKIVFHKEEGNDHQGFTYCKTPGLYWMEAKVGSKPNLIVEEGEKPSFNKDGSRIFYMTGGYLFGSLQKAFKSCKLDGGEPLTHYNSTYANQYAVSPDNQWLAFGELHQVYVTPLVQNGLAMNLSSGSKDFPITRITQDAGINIHWSTDSKNILWTLGDEYFSRKLSDCFTFVPNAPDSLPKPSATGLKVGLKVQSDAPKGLLALKNARIITMNAQRQVIENGVVLIENNRIKAVGTAAEVQIPANTKTVDLSGKTIIPGLVDVHAHLGTFRQGLSPQKQWQYYANLAYGVTTTHDPSSNSEMVFSQAEMVKAGQMVGPRIFSTGTIIYGADGDFKAVINNLNDAESALRRTQAYGAFSVKSYNQPRREQRQQVIQAAQKLGMMVYPEGGSHFFHNMTMILDGHTSIEHNIPVAPLYNDVVKLWSASKTVNAPTLIVCYGAVNGEYYWYQNTNVWEKQRLLNFTPRSVLDARARHRTMIPQGEYENGHILVSKSLKKLHDAGVCIGVGGHGQLQGLGVHWEMWMLAQGGMSSMEALQCATINGAKYIHMEKDLGSIEPNKLADLVVLDKNPLENIQYSEYVNMTMINGRLYDANTMHETGNYERKRSKFFWELNGQNNNFPWHESTKSFERIKCACGKH
ncbi:MAG: amidohydrolase [Cytophagales bacterium]|nr:MAG: amidohydrolase [Cytophagales bacterium]TAF60971.1 MAG: amidohydrolase [Cytophagales bacterium]